MPATQPDVVYISAAELLLLSTEEIFRRMGKPLQREAERVTALIARRCCPECGR